ncbi:MAG: hypothetical protein Q4D04_12030 [Clostridia bacterium]|nr:hypothetical protein [Clostridia bacterium]
MIMFLLALFVAEANGLFIPQWCWVITGIFTIAQVIAAYSKK